MSLLDGLQPANKTAICKVMATIRSLEAMDQVILELAIDDKSNWTPNGLSKALRTRGIILGKDTIRNHRENACPCSKA
jgi:hypothetical protein